MTPKEAVRIGMKEGPSDETRAIACLWPYDAYVYALLVDNCPRDDTRTAACVDPKCAFDYAWSVDEEPCEETREAAYKSEKWGNEYRLWESDPESYVDYEER